MSCYRESKTAQKILEARIGTQSIEGWANQDRRIKSLLIRFLQPRECLISLVKSHIDQGDVGGISVVLI